MDWSNLQADYERLGTQQAVANEYGCTRGMVDKRMRRAGIRCHPRRGRTHEWSEEWRANHRAATNTPEFKEAHRASLLNRFDEMRGKSADSPLEALLHGALKRAGIGFVTQRRKLGKYIVDIELTQAQVIVEADGLLHRLPEHKAKDAVRDQELTEAGYTVYRFTGTEINADPDACITKVITASCLAPDENPVAEVRRGGRGEDNPLWKGGQRVYRCEQCGDEFNQWEANRKYRKPFCRMECYSNWKRAHPEASPVHARWANHPKMTDEQLAQADALLMNGDTYENVGSLFGQSKSQMFRLIKVYRNEQLR